MNNVVIGGTEIAPGEHQFVEINVARLPSGTLIQMPVHVFRSKNPGPVILLSGGLHGDEINGIEIVRRLVDGPILKNLMCGTVIALPIINVYGFLHFSRDVPDGKDVNRSFPGSPDGSLAAIVANLITKEILPVIDFGVDFHTGGASRTNHPQIRFAKEDEKGREIASIFGAPMSLHSGLIQGSLRATAKDFGKSIVVFEGGETLRLNEYVIEEAIKGVKRLLHHHGMCKQNPKAKKQHFFSASTWVRADASGLFVHKKQAGQKVKKGQTIGWVHSPYNDYHYRIKCPVDGYIIGHNNFPLVHRGDAVFHIGYDLSN